MSVVDVREAVTQAHHEEWARVVAWLTTTANRNTAETAYLTRRRDQLG